MEQIEPTGPEKDRYIAEKLGFCWHEPVYGNIYHPFLCSCGEDWRDEKYVLDHCHDANPDFAADPLRLLREMHKQRGWYEFLAKSLDHYQQEYGQDVLHDFAGYYLLNTTGRLRDAAYEWLKGRDKSDDHRML